VNFNQSLQNGPLAVKQDSSLEIIPELPGSVLSAREFYLFFFQNLTGCHMGETSIPDPGPCKADAALNMFPPPF
jgi:hypothetical protein